VISRSAIAGFYYFASGRAFAEATQRSIFNGRAVNSRYFIAPVLNEIVLGGQGVGNVAISADQYQSFYSPNRLDYYERQYQAARATRATFAEPRRAPPLNIVIPMAGRGERFVQAGYDKPKPFIDVAGMTMIERVMDNLATPDARFILIARREHMAREPAAVAALEARGNVTFAPIDDVTEGAACTVLTARRHLDADAPLLIANCDQVVDFDCQAFVRDAQDRALQGSILVFPEPGRDPKWSYARLGPDGLVAEVREKVAISDLATVGLYYFSQTRHFLDAAIDMIARNDRVNGEFYVCPIYNYLIGSGGRTGVFEAPAASMHGMGVPADLQAYLARLADRK